jgi:hypothetical protein
MTELLSNPWYLAIVPACALVGAIVVSKVLNISQLASLFGAFAPLGLPYADLSVSTQSVMSKPPVQVLGGWGIMLALALAWVVMRALLRAVKGPMGLVRVAYSLLLAAAGGVVLLLVFDPSTLQTIAPAWRESFGGILLATMVASLGLTLIRVFRSAAFLVLCSAATAILASQVLFEKMPYDLERDDLRKIQQAIPDSLPKGLVETGLDTWVRVAASSRGVFRSTPSADIES